MTAPATANEVAAQLAELARELERATTELNRLDDAAVRAKSRYEVAYARAFLTAEGAMDVRKQQAVLDVADQRLAAEVAEQQVRATKEHIRTLRDRLDVGRSLGAALRSQMIADGSMPNVP